MVDGGVQLIFVSPGATYEQLAYAKPIDEVADRHWAMGALREFRDEPPVHPLDRVSAATCAQIAPRFIEDANKKLRHRARRPLAAGAEGAAASGLVPSTTSDPPARLKIEIDRLHVRAQRMRRSILTGARLHVEEATKGGFRGRWAMLTLTYREGVDASARHISALLHSIRSYLRRAGHSGRGSRFRYVWALELTQRLRPHYHLLIWLPKGMTLPKPDKRGWWAHGSTRIEWARRAVGYVAKYASKFTSEVAAHMPKGMKSHGVGGLDGEGKRELRWWKSPRDAREHLGEKADIRKVLGGYADKLTGLLWPSPWSVCISADGRVFAIREVPL